METETGWCILRTSGGRTLRLAKSLRDAGIGAWTPSQVRQILRRRGLGAVATERDVPMVPTFVFADKNRVEELLSMARRSSVDYPPFSVFRFSGRIPVIADSEIEALRTTEERAKRNILKRYRFDVKKGSIVRPKVGPWAGLEGVVEDTAGNFAVVCFTGLRVKIASWLLGDEEVEEEAKPRWRAADRASKQRAKYGGESRDGKAAA